jgi:hypothetical protein
VRSAAPRTTVVVVAVEVVAAVRAYSRRRRPRPRGLDASLHVLPSRERAHLRVIQRLSRLLVRV